MAYKDLETKRAYFREYYTKNRVKHMAGVRANILKIKKAIDELKVNSGCIDCGYNVSSEALEYDHVSKDKVFEISYAVAHGFKISRIMEEIAKCELVCANCHRVRTAKRRQVSITANISVL